MALLAGGAIKKLDYPNATSTLANSLNSAGAIVGNYTSGGVTHGFLVSNGKSTSIDVAGAAFTGAYGIDTAGNIVGRYRDAAGVTHGFVKSGGAFTTIDIAGATSTAAASINEAGDIVARYTAGGISHGFVLTSPSVRYQITDLGTLPGGIAIGLNKKGQVVGQAETSSPDDEDFCAYGTGFQCSPFFWQNGLMTPLAALGGRNGAVSAINGRGEAAGLAENATLDPHYHAPQRFDFEAVVWGPGQGKIRELRPLPADTVGIPFWINDKGQVTGTSGTCDNVLNSGVLVGPHAVLWERDGSVVDLGSLGGTVDISLLGVGNRGICINNQGQVVGGPALSGNKTAHAFLWTPEAGMKDLGVLPGDGNSGALGTNERGEVVGVSQDTMGNPRAFLWAKRRHH